jgi:hypothetical protein
MPFLGTLIAFHNCNKGVFPFMPLIVMPQYGVKGVNLNGSTVADTIMFMNILPFILCKSLANPITAALTAAHLGALTPGPCIPITSGKWKPGAITVMIKNKTALNMGSQVSCAFGSGKIRIFFPGQPLLIWTP